MPGVLAWVVAVECHKPQGDKPCPIDFKQPVSRRALEWADWLLQQPGVKLQMNVSARPGSAEAAHLARLKPQLLNAASAHEAGAAALGAALKRAANAAGEDVLLLVWIGHGVMHNRQRFLLHADTEDADNLESWELDSLLQRLRGAKAPPLQLGVFDTCAQVVSEAPGSQSLGGAGKTVRAQHCYFASTAAAIASLNPFEPTVASLLLQALQGAAWPPQAAQMAALDATLQAQLAALRSRPVRLEWTQGSGDLWSTREADGKQNAAIAQQARRSGYSETLFRHLWRELQGSGDLLGRLAQALRGAKVDALADELAALDPDASEPDLLRDAWQRVQQVERWAPRADALRLSLPQWAELASQLIDQDARVEEPVFSELRELLLWALDLGGKSRRAQAAFVRLLWLAAALARRDGGAVAAAAGTALQAALQADAALAPLLAEVQAGARGPAPHWPAC
jgi:hypothetical protein